jgi:hypothetical protein
MPSKHCVRTTDEKYIKTVLTHPTIWPHIKGEEKSRPEDYNPPIDDETHFLKVDGGLFILHPYRDGMKIHANMIERGKAALRAYAQVEEYAKELGVRVLYAVIPEINPNVTAFAKGVGFKVYKSDKEKHYLRLEL